MYRSENHLRLMVAAQRKDRHLFLRSTAPIRGLMHGSDAVGTIVR
jgi:hypothetical protein